MSCAALATAPMADAWELAKLNGRDYVTLDSVKQFYRFDKMVRSGKSVTLENRSVVMKVKVGEQDCYMNNVKFVFSYKVEASGSKVLVSRIDLAKLIEVGVSSQIAEVHVREYV